MRKTTLRALGVILLLSLYWACGEEPTVDVEAECTIDCQDDDQSRRRAEPPTEPDDGGLPPDEPQPEPGEPADSGPDSDGDGIADLYEGTEDTDGDGIPDAEDDDSDNDGWSDAEEYGRAAGSGYQPVDTDLDGIPDFRDLDSDGDGLADADELGCPDSTDRTSGDSDNDGVADPVEVGFGSDPCDASDDISDSVDFYFELPWMGPIQRAPLDIMTRLDSGDIVFNMDTTGSMSQSIESLTNSLESMLIPFLTQRHIADLAVGVSRFDDFPCQGYGSDTDRPFGLEQRVTTDPSAAQQAVSRLRAVGGGDKPESGIEALFQLAVGTGRESFFCDSGDYCDRTADCPETFSCVDGLCQTDASLPFDYAVGLVEGISDGEGGGAGFRESTARVIVQITDAPVHAAGQTDLSSTPYPYGATRDETFQALRDGDTRVIGISVNREAFGGRYEAGDDLEDMARQTGAVVPTCAWDGSRPSGCATNQCCTGENAAGETADTDGDCPLVFKVRNSLIPGTGGGLPTAVISGIDALLGGEPFDISPVLRPDPDELERSGLDTTCFIEAVVAQSATPSGCSADPEPADLDGDGINESFLDVGAGSVVTFEVIARNDCVEQTNTAQSFIVYIDLLATDGTELGSRLVSVLVPPHDPKTD